MEAIWTMTLTGSLLILLVLLLRAALGRRLPPRVLYALWLPVLLCLLVPLRLPSAVSILNAAPVQQVDRAVAQIAAQPLTLHPQEEAATNPLPGAEIEPEQSPATQAAAQPPAGGGLEVGTVLLAVWAVGAATTASVIVGVNLKFAARVRRSRIPVQDLEHGVGRALARQLHGVRVYCSKAVYSPCLMGVFRPCIVLTPAAMENPEHLRHVLVHELAHKRQGDAVIALLRSVALVLHWFNPLVWFAAACSREDCESACDAMAIQALGEAARIDYGKTLLAFVARKPTAAALVNATTAMAQTRGGIRRRIRRIARGKRRFAAALSALAIVAALTGCAVTLTGPSAEAPTAAPAEEAVPAEEPAAEETESPAATNAPDNRPQAVVEAMETYESALAGLVPDFQDLSPTEAEDLLPELQLDFALYGRRNANGDTYIVALPREEMAITPVPMENLEWSMGTLSPGDTMEEYWQLQQHGTQVEDGERVLLREYLVVNAQSVQILPGDLFLVLVDAPDSILFDAMNPTTMAIRRAAQERGMTYGEELDPPYGVVYLMDDQTREATGLAERLEFRFPLEGAEWEDLLERLHQAEVEQSDDVVSRLDDGIVTAEATYSLCADRLRVRSEDGRRGDILDAELAQAVREAFAQKRGADPLDVSLAWLDGAALTRATLEFPALVEQGAEWTYEMRAQTIEDAEALAELQALLRGAEETAASGCPFGGTLTLVREDGETLVLYTASDSCAVLTADGGLYFEFGNQEDLLDIFPNCRGAFSPDV